MQAGLPFGSAGFIAYFLFSNYLTFIEKVN